MKPRIFLAAIGILALATHSGAQTPASSALDVRPFEIVDNSFLVEEAFNQEKGVFQNIFGWTRTDDGGWESSFTQEWPLLGMTHQFSYTVPFSGGDLAAHFGGVLINYRFQALEEERGHPAFSPRFSIILPTGRSDDGSDRPGLQVNLPFSKQAGDLYFHWNAGVTWLHAAPLGNGHTTNLTTPHLAASAIWRTTPLFHLMLESVLEFEATIDETSATGHQRALTVSPGFRRAWNIGEKQIVIGAAVPVITGAGDTTFGALTYFSYELPFTANR
jgi:hypothetical protein